MAAVGNGLKLSASASKRQAKCRKKIIENSKLAQLMAKINVVMAKMKLAKMAEIMARRSGVIMKAGWRKLAAKAWHQRDQRSVMAAGGVGSANRREISGGSWRENIMWRKPA
jgi:hypothetical protein